MTKVMPGYVVFLLLWAAAAHQFGSTSRAIKTNLPTWRKDQS